MRTDRLLGITVYLLNHGRTGAKELAQRFEVSVRTVQRDMDSLGIPVTAHRGSQGGYELLDTFGMAGQPMGETDYENITAALRGLTSAWDDPKARETQEKMQAMGGGAQPLRLDWSAAAENPAVSRTLALLRAAIREKSCVSFGYTNAAGVSSRRTVEPAALLFRWYAWYLAAYVPEKEDYALFKLVRMAQVCPGAAFERTHDPDAVLRSLDTRQDTREYWDVLLRGEADVRAACVEYLNGTITEELADGGFLMRLHVPCGERFWLGAVLSMGGQVTVLEPEALRRRVCVLCQAIQRNYDIQLS
ncbi:MAG: YafY family protein [Eubacteriales bacterium]|nr:YafY family protein [Eubacteriales bacterium]